MGISFKRAQEALGKIKRHKEKALVIHYACQSLYDDRDGLSPRVANIVVKDFANDQTVSFATHLTAEKLHIDKAEIENHFDDIETQLLQDFYAFVQNHSGSLWLHWNMTNIQYGFDTLAHRHFILTGKNAPGIDIDNRINIAGILNGLYGENYVGNPHMPKLMELNGGVRRDFVPGVEEVELFKDKEYARLHASTVAKVKFFCDVVELVIDRKLKVQRPNLYTKIDRATEGLIAKLVGLAAALYTIVDLTTRAVHIFK